MLADETVNLFNLITNSDLRLVYSIILALFYGGCSVSDVEEDRSILIIFEDLSIAFDACDRVPYHALFTSHIRDEHEVCRRVFEKLSIFLKPNLELFCGK
jgi:hypothetical protein